MDIKNPISRERIVDALHILSSLRISVSRSTLLTVSALILIFFIAFFIRLLPIRWGLELSEFDPYFQFRFAEKIVNDGYFDWVNWNDVQRWYPIGYEVNIGTKAFPGLPLTAATLYNILSGLGVPISLYNLCVLFPAIFGALACLAAFFLGRDVAGKTAGLLSAFFLALTPSHISRTSAGFFDDETVGIGAILLFAFLFLRALDQDRPQKYSIIYAIAAGLTIGYITASWGAAIYPIAMATLFVFILIILRRYSRRLLTSYSITFGIGLFLAINVPKLSIRYLANWTILPIVGVFALLCLSEVVKVMKTAKWKLILVVSFLAVIVVGFLALSYFGYVGSIAGKFLSVLDPTQRGTSEIYQSVQEHRLTAWGSIYYDYGIGVFFFALGLFFAVRDLTHRNLFIVVFGITALYFASSMVRLTILLAPVFCILMAVGIVSLLRPFVTLMKEAPKLVTGRKYVTGRVGKEFSGLILILIFGLLTLTYAFPSPRMYNNANSPPTILAASVPIKPTDPVIEWTEMLSWMQLNLPNEAMIVSWWDYGYWITVKGNRTSLADNATFNTTHIGSIGQVFMSNETEALRILQERFDGPNGPPTHILVFTSFTSLGGDQGYGDEGKWRWMARIANETVAPGSYREWGDREQYNTFGEVQENQWIWNDLGKNTTIYRLMQFGKEQIAPSGAAPILEHFEPAHFSPGIPIAAIGTAGDQTVYLHALVCLYEINYT